MTAYEAEFFSMNDVNRLRILQDVIDRRLMPGLGERALRIIRERYAEQAGHWWRLPDSVQPRAVLNRLT
ncbi:hypothetical protein ACVNT8_004331 [Enterobacter cloacae]